MAHLHTGIAPDLVPKLLRSQAERYILPEAQHRCEWKSVLFLDGLDHRNVHQHTTEPTGRDLEDLVFRVFVIGGGQSTQDMI